MNRLLLTVFLFLASTGWAGPIEDAEAAYKQGDYATALRILRPLAEQGMGRAQIKLGMMYDQGLGVAKDYEEAVKWFRMGAAQGNVWAQITLGDMYSQGKDIARDYAEAVKWYRLAAVQGHALGQVKLGLMYRRGFGVVQDYVLAQMWFNLGAVSGDADAVQNRDIITKEMTPQQIGEAQKMARECQARQLKGCD